jgi:hypothetical protein
MRSILAPAVSPKLENGIGFPFENSLHDQLAAETLAKRWRRGGRFSPSGLPASGFPPHRQSTARNTTLITAVQT